MFFLTRLDCAFIEGGCHQTTLYLTLGMRRGWRRLAMPGADLGWEAAAGRWVDREQRGAKGSDEMSVLSALLWVVFMCAAVAYCCHRGGAKREWMHERDSDSWSSAGWSSHRQEGLGQQLVRMLSSPLSFWADMQRAKRDDYGELDSLIERHG